MAPNDLSIEKTATDYVEKAPELDDIKEAKLASDSEHQTTLWQALKSNKKAAFWSAIISLTIIMEGYDVGEYYCLAELTHFPALTLSSGLIYQFFGYPSFAQTFGKYDPTTGSYQVSGPWQAGLANGANCGIIIGYSRSSINNVNTWTAG